MGAGNRIIAVTPTTYDKALELNLDPQVYGTFAEIGAGQETANWFFRASGTAGLVAKTISAYDMTMSDAIYGRTERYVSASRLAAMLDHEYAILLERLAPKRGQDTTFFSFCNTVRARGYKDSGECHGWLGIRFQMKPGDPPSDIMLHVRLLDPRAIRPDGGARHHRREPDPLGVPPPRAPQAIRRVAVGQSCPGPGGGGFAQVLRPRLRLFRQPAVRPATRRERPHRRDDVSA